MKSAFVWNNVTLSNSAILKLEGANVLALNDDERSWPKPGNLMVDGFTYSGLAPPRDAQNRLRWLRLQNGFSPQPYRQLAKFLSSLGDTAGAVRVLIEEQDARYANYGLAGKLWGGFLKFTIGYGHRPLLAIFWMLLVVLVGMVVVRAAKRAGVMRLTWPETTPPPTGDPTIRLRPLLYSLDVFVPFVNLHQEHYWWPESQESGDCVILNMKLRVHGSLIEYYLWLQIIAGWLLSAIFIAGVTGLIRND